MLSPEEDYDTWSLIVTTVEDDLPSFANFCPDINRLFTSISQTGMLPDPISNRTDEFVSLQYNITNSFLSFYGIDESALNILIDYFKTIIEFSLSQLKTRTQIVLSILSSCFDDNYNLYKYNPNLEIRTTLIQFFISINGYKQMIEFIKTETTSIENIIKVSELIIKIKENVESFDELDFSNTICDILIQIASSDIRALPVTTIEPLIAQMPKSEKWLSLFKIFLKTDIFDKRLFSLKQIDQMLYETNYIDITINFLKESIDSILSVPPHQEFYPLLGHICVVSLKHKIISIDKIQELWNNQEFVHQSELQSFFSMFNAISKELPSSYAIDFTNMFMNPKTKSLEWVKALSISCTNIMVLGYKTEFIELRNELFRIGFIDMTNSSQEARRGIVNVSAVLINQLLPQVINEEKVKASIDDILYLISLTLNSQEKVEDPQPIIDFCFKHMTANQSSSIITTLCINHNAKINDAQLHQLMMNPSCLTLLYNAHIINDDTMDNYFLSITSFNSGIAGILMNYIYSHSNFPLTSLPIPKQDLLWYLAIKFKSYELSNGIGDIYSRNDGFLLSDSAIITEFLNIFEYHYKNSENDQQQRSFLYKLLDEFIEKFEVNADFEYFRLKRHKPYQNDSIVKINVQQLNLYVTAALGNTVAVAVKKILDITGKNQYDTIVKFNGQFIHYDFPINKFRYTNNIYANYQDYQSKNPIPRIQLVRSSIPSLRICNCNLMNSLVDDLKDYGCWQLRVLINKLPTSKHLLQKINNLQKMNSYDFESLIMIDYPYYSIYVLESLFGASLSFQDLNRTGCISYIISIIPRFKIKAQIYLVLSFLSGLEIDQLNIYADQLFDSLLRVILTQDYNLSTHCLLIIDKLTPQIPPYETFKLIPTNNMDINRIPEPKIAQYNNENKEDELKEINATDSTSQILSNVIVKFIFGSNEEIRNSFSTSFSHLSIPLSYFTPHLDQINSINCNSLLTTVSESLKEHNKEIADFSLNNFNVESPIFSFIIKVFLEQLQNGQYDQLSTENVDYKNKVDKVFNCLANNFLKAEKSNYSPQIIDDAFEILNKAPSSILKTKLEAISHVELTEYEIDGDEFSVQPTTTGLKNLGMSCFLNSTLQQFYGIPCVRKAIISYNDKENNSNRENATDSLFFTEMKKLFIRMRESVESFVSPKNVVDKWITWDGTVLNPIIQQDASEFVQMLIDKLTLGKIIPQSTFNGTLAQVIESIEDKNLFTTTRNESFSILSVSISTTLEESFDKIHTPDFLNDYYAEPLNRKIDAKKTEFLGQNLPDHLIIQLKRFKFEYTTYERQKVNDPVFFTQKIDLKKHCFLSDDNKNDTIYILSGVIIHIGGAESGHYISYVKQRDTGNWYEYNDQIVTPITLDYVMTNSNLDNQNAYILFYDKEGLNEVDDSELDPEMKIEITKRNGLSNFYSVFCSSKFINFITELAKRNDMEREVIFYIINVLPHLYFIEPQISILITLTKKILMKDENLCHFFLENIKSFKPILFEIPYEAERSLFCKDIFHPLFKKNKIDEKTFKKIIDLFDQGYNQNKLNENYFMTLYWASKYNLELAEKFEIRKKVEELINIIIKEHMPTKTDETTTTTTKADENDNQHQRQLILKQKSSYCVTDFGWLAKILIILCPSDEFLEKIETDIEIFKFFILSFSDSKKYMKLYDDLEKTKNKKHKEKCEELILNFLNKYSLYLSMPFVCGILFVYFKEKAISIFPQLKFNLNGNLCNIADIAFCYTMLAHNEICDQLLLDHLNEWFIPLSLCNNLDARDLANQAVAQLIRHTKISEKIGPIRSRDEINYPDSYFYIVTYDTVNTIEMMNRIRIILNCLISNLDKVKDIIEKENPNAFVPSTPKMVESSLWKSMQFQCYSYLKIMSILSDLSKQEIVPSDIKEIEKSNFLNPPVDLSKLIEFSHFLIQHSQPYDAEIKLVVKSLNDEIDDEFIDGIAVDLFNGSDEEEQLSTSTSKQVNTNLPMLNYNISTVLKYLLPVIEKRTSLKETIIHRFAQHLCFSNMNSLFAIQEYIPRLITALTKLNKDVIIKIIDSDIEKACTNNMTSVLFALKTMNEKRDISRFFDSCSSNKYYSFDDIIRIFIECNNGRFPELKRLFWLLNTGYYSLQTRKAIWKCITDFDADYLLFKSNFNNKDYGKSNGDYIEIANYLISRFDKEQPKEKEEIINDLIFMSTIYMNVFSLCYSILRNNAIDKIKDKKFIKSIFSQKIGQNGQIFFEYSQNIALPLLSPEEITEYFASMNDFILQNLQSYNEILVDPINDAFNYAVNDDNNALTDAITCLEFIIKVKLSFNKDIKQVANGILEKLSNEEIWRRVKNEKIKRLKESLNELLKI